VKQKIFLIVALLFLVPVSIYLAFFQNKTSYDEKMEIDLMDTSQISEIRITEAMNAVNITKVADKWLVNGAYNANEYAVKRLFRIFKNLEINTLIPESEHDSTAKLLKEKGVSISFFENKKLKSKYCIGKYDEIKKGTLMMTDEELPVYVSAPGLTSDIRKFVEADPVFWRNKRIFNFKPAEIESIVFYDYKIPANSFQIEVQNSKFQVFDQSHHPIKFDNEKISRYISYFENIDFESVAEVLTVQKTDSIFKQQASYLVKVKSINTDQFELKLVPIELQNGQNQFDLNKCYGILNNQKPVVMINYFAIDPIIKEISYFKGDSSK
jgi:hypothetical protein